MDKTETGSVELVRAEKPFGHGNTQECPQCGGSGWVHGTGMAHASNCDGSCRHCPVPVEVQEPCDMCGGYGRVPP